MSIKREIYSAIQDRGAMTVYEIAVAIDRKYSTWLRNHVDDMVVGGDLKRFKRPKDNGRPAYVYDLRDKYRNLRSEWQAERSRGYPFTYEMWLEEKLKDCRNGG